LYLITFLRPYWTKWRPYARLAIDAAGEYFVPAARLAALPEGGNASQVVDIINVIFQIGFIITAVIVVIQIVKQLQTTEARDADAA
jgi:hypothetical protein